MHFTDSPPPARHGLRVIATPRSPAARRPRSAHAQPAQLSGRPGCGTAARGATPVGAQPCALCRRAVPAGVLAGD
ncbi:MAG: hypothetical protein IPJ97_19270 [Proteobacteria bacterium]|nr:hypothetical protein [Pseudomonadota bacterium]